MKGKIAVIGGGIAGVQAASSLAKDWDTTLILGENHLPYYRMRIEEVIAGAEPESLFMHPAAWYEEKGIHLIHDRASSIDREGHSVVLEDGQKVPYDKLVITTGSNAFSFPLGGRTGNTFSLRTMDDALNLRTALLSADSFTVIGGGLLGLELAYSVSLSFRIPVSVIESGPYILSRQLDEDSAGMLQESLERSGVKVLAGVTADHADDSFLYLSDGTSVPAAVICFSIGVRCEKTIAENAGLVTDKGIVVNSGLCTSDPDILAAGDAVELDGRTFGLAMHAREMGMKAAAVINGDTTPYIPSEPSALLKVGGIDVASLGSMTGEKKVFEGADSRVTVFVENGTVRGIVLINAKSVMAAARNAIGKGYDEAVFRTV